MKIMTPEIANKLADVYAEELMNTRFNYMFPNSPEQRKFVQDCIAIGYLKGASDAVLGTWDIKGDR